MRKKLALLHEFDDNVAVVATTVASITTGIVQFHSGKMTPAEVAGSTWGWVCMPGACPRWQWAWLRCQQAFSSFRLTVSLLKQPFASAANATSERIANIENVTERSTHAGSVCLCLSIAFVLLFIRATSCVMLVYVGICSVFWLFCF